MQEIFINKKKRFPTDCMIRYVYKVLWMDGELLTFILLIIIYMFNERCEICYIFNFFQVSINIRKKTCFS